MAMGLTNLGKMVIMVKIKQLYMFKVMTLLFIFCLLSAAWIKSKKMSKNIFKQMSKNINIESMNEKMYVLSSSFKSHHEKLRHDS